MNIDFEDQDYVKKWTREPELYWYEQMIFDRFFEKAGNVLVVGCGTGRDSVPLAQRGHKVIGVDVSRKMIKTAKKLYPNEKNVAFLIADASYLPLEPNSFNYCIFSCQTINLVPDFRSAIAESCRVLKKDGVLTFTMHNPHSFNAIVYRKQMLPYLHTQQTMSRELKTAGFENISVNSLRTLSKPESIFSKYPFSLFHHLLIYCCRKL